MTDRWRWLEDSESLPPESIPGGQQRSPQPLQKRGLQEMLHLCREKQMDSFLRNKEDRFHALKLKRLVLLSLRRRPR
jgi:hypothetical protein